MNIDSMLKIWNNKVAYQKYVSIRRELFQNDIILSADTDKPLICGDSHVEGLKQNSAFEEFVHGGVGGVDAGAYADIISSMNFSTIYPQSILIVGSNDIGKSHAASEKSTGEFVKNVNKIVSTMKNTSILVKISAVPPVPKLAGARREPILVEIYSEKLKEICVSQNCIFFDPFAFMRDARFGLSKPGMHIDNIHLKDYNELAQSLCALM